MSEVNMYFDNSLMQWVIEKSGAIVAFGGSPTEVLQNAKEAIEELEDGTN